MHTDRYLNFRSHHHPRTFSGAVKSLKHRAINICQPEKQEEELQHLKDTFHRNGYPSRVIDPIMKKSHSAPKSKG